MGLISRLQAFVRDAGRGPLPEMALMLRDRLADAGPEAGLRLEPLQRAAFDRVIDGLNRLPRPVMAVGTLTLIASALVAPDWFAGRMEALAVMPEALWWIIGGVISLYFGARFQAHDQAFQREVLGAVVAVPGVPPPGAVTPQVAATGTDAALEVRALRPGENPALATESLTQR
jgi:hypothetical protein